MSLQAAPELPPHFPYLGSSRQLQQAFQHLPMNGEFHDPAYGLDPGSLARACQAVANHLAKYPHTFFPYMDASGRVALDIESIRMQSVDLVAAPHVPRVGAFGEGYPPAYVAFSHALTNEIAALAQRHLAGIPNFADAGDWERPNWAHRHMRPPGSTHRCYWGSWNQ